MEASGTGRLTDCETIRDLCNHERARLTIALLRVYNFVVHVPTVSGLGYILIKTGHKALGIMIQMYTPTKDSNSPRLCRRCHCSTDQA
jgi:hypothetical protein